MAKGQPWLLNLILDTGLPARAGSYSPADEAYADLLHRHAQGHFSRIPKAVADDLLKHFRDRDAAF